ncbi:MAG: hypothetical protein IJT69_04960 [Clostridia bacterium]|nr:hypothetical protein [Clostridia bacterium]
MIRKKTVAFLIVLLLITLALLPACRQTDGSGALSARIEGKTLSWDAYEGAAAYAIRCTLTDGTGYTITTDETTYVPPYAAPGDHLYVVYALNADGERIATSEPLLYHLGAGSYADPILISSADELAEITGSVTVLFGETKVSAPLYYRLTRDLDLTGVEFTPIGNSSNPFSGIFDGDGHTITGLSFTKCNTDGKVGLFGDTSVAVIKNLTLKDASMRFDKNSGVSSSDLRFGLLVGSALETYIDNCHVSGEMDILTKVVTTDSSKALVGGICGSATSGAITGCSFTGNITAQYGWIYAGGIIGEVKSGTPRFALLNCSSNATVKGVGTAYNVTSGNVETYARVGVVGGNVANAERIASIFAVGSASASSYHDGAAVSRLTHGVFGRTLMSGSYSAISFYHVYYDEAIGEVVGSGPLGTAYASNAHPLSAEEISLKESYLEGDDYGLDFDGAWRMTDGSLPTLAGTGSLPHSPEITLTIATADGKTSYDFTPSEIFLPKCYPTTLGRMTEYHVGYQVDSLLSSLNVAHAKGTRVRFSAEGLEDVTVEVGASNTLPYLIYALYGVPENAADVYAGYKIVDPVLLTTYDFTTAKKITITVLPAESEA